MELHLIAWFKIIFSWLDAGSAFEYDLTTNFDLNTAVVNQALP